LADKKTGKACGSPETREYIENVDKLFWGGGRSGKARGSTQTYKYIKIVDEFVWKQNAGKACGSTQTCKYIGNANGSG